MPLILTTPPSAEPLSLPEAKAHLRVAHNDDDAYIDKLIIAARRACEMRSNLCFITQGWSVYADRWPDDGVLSLALAPVSAIADVILYGEDDTPATLDPAHYYLDPLSRPSRVVLRDGRARPQAGRRINGVEVRVTAGFGAAPAVPQDLKQAMLATLAHWFDRRGEGEGAALPLSALELLSGFRHARLA